MEYLGDGVYAKIESGMIKLQTDRTEGGVHIIYLEPQVLAALFAFVKKNIRPEIWAFIV